MTPQRATLTGMLAIILWSTSVGLIRSLTEALGPIGGAAMIYSTSTLCLLVFYGLPRIKTLPRIYLFAGGALFVCYEIFLSLSIGLADSRMQAMEIGMINYLW
ncbi:EamA family transporter, partial [Dickeya dadantii]|nr:EamA family transporter [Dickeya dadantii]